ncbi:hypothetical protein HNP33_003435 [Comamonas odontotermitis]|uniref:Uncharacterized protein n=1 Tax=Comamonas odontotermitis TaxID=379895 RepID=A0ABR6RJG9_9BURK|nr:DUF5455 family protein [Comamonas odontotermitis]MBB6579323.1 hypothetical protein [Comamonas odontotermitis]
MPLLGLLLSNLLTALVAWFAQYVTRKVAFGGAVVVASSALTFGLFVVFRGVMTMADSALSGLPAMFVKAFFMAVPPAAIPCVSAYITIWTACGVYRWQQDLIHLFAKSN